MLDNVLKALRENALIWYRQDRETGVVRQIGPKLAGKSVGLCALYFRLALAKSLRVVPQRSAYLYAAHLPSLGFVEIPPAEPMPGDVVVFSNAPHGLPHGHVQMWDGTAWISDFVQRAFLPSTAYRLVPYKTFRRVWR